jgi:hypothetical protein
MTSSTLTSNNQSERDREIWDSLKKAIATSSGFKRWHSQHNSQQQDNLDLEVTRYLEETLKTLAY